MSLNFNAILSKIISPNLQAIYCYTTEGRGPCYAIEGKKKLLQISRTYLVVVAEDQKAAGNSDSSLPR